MKIMYLQRYQVMAQQEATHETSSNDPVRFYATWTSDERISGGLRHTPSRTDTRKTLGSVV
jgi:hypothetical protein